MAKAASSRSSSPALKDILSTIGKDKKTRQAVVKFLAKEHAKDYLQHVSIDQKQLSNISTRFISSNKEWQE